MAYRPLLRQTRAVVPLATGAVLAAGIFAPRTAFAEEGSRDPENLRKPIYDDPNADAPPPPPPSSRVKDDSEQIQRGPTPTDRLQVYVRLSRLQLAHYTSIAEGSLNDFLSRALHLENSFTSTVASLAPPRSSNERLMPNGIYVLVAAMAGSIITRNRGIVLRATMPLALGIGAGYYVLPITMRNIGDLVWTYEEKYPALRDTHLQIRERAIQIWETSKAHSAMTVQMGEEKLGELRGKAEDWVKKGK